MFFTSRKAIVVVVLAIGVYLLKQYSNGPLCTSSARLDGKTAIVTGANTGLGRETALRLVERGCQVILACRSMEKGERAAHSIKNMTGADESRVVPMQLDLSSFKSIRKFADDFKQKYSKLHLLINNAAIVAIGEYTETEDGLEMQIGVNHFGHVLLTNLLMGSLINSVPSRVIMVSGRLHEQSPSLSSEDIQYIQRNSKVYGRWEAYARSKLANNLFARELGRRLEGTKVTTYAAHPGVIMTDVLRNMPLLSYNFIRDMASMLVWPIWKDLQHGVQTTLCCAIDENLAKETGKYYADCAEAEPSDASKDDDIALKLWEASIKIVGLKPAEIHPNLA